MKSKLEIIQETVDFYSKDPEVRRAFDETVCFCRYYDPNTGNRCAVGRYSISEDLDVYEEGSFQYFINEYANFANYDFGELEKELLNEKVRGHSIEFWNDLQVLHDVQFHWNACGLTSTGEEFVEFLKNKYRD